MRIHVLLPMLLAAPAWLGAQTRARPEGDEWLRKPVDDRTFRTFLSFFAYDRQQPFDLKVASTQESDGLHAEVVSFQSGPGVRVTARILQGSGAARGGPGFVLMHGGTPPGKDSPYIKSLQEFLARAGYTSIAFDLQYFGERRTDLLTTYSEPEKHEKLYNAPSAYLSFVTQTVKDAGRSYDLLVERGVAPKRIALIGVSRGGQLSLIVGGADNRFATVIDLIGGHFDALETGHHPAACPANYIGRITPRPLLMFNGKLDADYNREQDIEPLQRLAREPRQFVWHEEGHTLPAELTRATVLGWLREKLK